jgi:UDP:flavonoid glycosyltransferase YjiC (YdhE family)
MSGLKILCAWEYGQNLGHVSSLISVSIWATQIGVEPVWVVPRSRREFVEANIQWQCHSIEDSPKYTHANLFSYADILACHGFLHEVGLADRLRAWWRLFEQEKPACIVLDCAPTAQLAAYFLGIRTLQISNGFDAPPVDCPTFGVGLRGQHIEKMNAGTVTALDETLASLGRNLVKRADASLARYLDFPTRLVARIPEVDPYGWRQDVSYIGPPIWRGENIVVDWPKASNGQRKIFAYLRGSPLLRAILEWLAESGMSVLCCCPDLPHEQQMLGQTMKIVKKPVSIQHVHANADVVVSYGATTFVCQTLLAGLPQWIVPSDVEKWMVGAQLKQLSVCAMTTTEKDFAAAFSEVNDEQMMRNVSRIAECYRGINWPDKLHTRVASPRAA